MADLTIILGNKNYSSWSLRAWLAARQAGIAFDEIVIPLYRPESREKILAHSPSGKVPALRHGAAQVWESLAICEYLAETFPEAALWPRDAAARAAARAVSTEMHAGFLPLRRHLPMNLRRAIAARQIPGEVEADINRICAIWRDCRARFGAKGPFLFGGFTIADAMYAPVATRFHTYAVALDRVCEAYGQAIMTLPAMQEWIEAAHAEPWVVENFEV